MSKRIIRAVCFMACLLTAALAATAGTAGADGYPAHHPLYMPNVNNMSNPALQPPPVCCVPAGPPVAGEPAPVNMAYFGGHVQVAPKIYLVFWGWGQAGAFDHVTPGMPTYDPDGAAARMTNFVKAFGGTAWSGSQTQYYQTINGWNQHIDNPTNQLGGVWYDNTNPIHNNVTGLELAQEAQRAVAHFGVTDLHEQPVRDRPAAEVRRGRLQQRRRLLRVARLHAEAVLPRRPGGHLVHEHALRPELGHELRPELRQHGLLRRPARRLHDRRGSRDRGDGHRSGAEDVINGVNLGGWYDYSAYENGDKCAWVGYSEGIAPASTVPGGLNNITGNDGKQYPVQSLWSNDAAGGAGYCAGAGDDLPG